MRIRVPKGCSRSFEFQVVRRGGPVDLTGYTVEVVVDGLDGTEVYREPCPPAEGDPKTRIVTVEGEASATVGLAAASCVHFTDAAGKADAEPFDLEVYDHA
jgi:hypothetical protein